VAETPLLRRAALTRADLAGFLEPYLRALEARIREGRAESVREQLAAWEDALGEMVRIAPGRLAALARLRWFEEAVHRFRLDQAYRRDALAALNAAIVSGVAARVARWRWAGVAYGDALHEFVLRGEQRVERDERARVVRRDVDAAYVARYSVLNGALKPYTDVLRDGSATVPRSLHAATRGLHLLAEARRHERQLEAERKRYDLLMQQARSQLDADVLAQVQRIERTSVRIMRLEHLRRQQAERAVEARLDEAEERAKEDWSKLDRLLEAAPLPAEGR
jgi:hypothetical protein